MSFEPYLNMFTILVGLPFRLFCCSSSAASSRVPPAAAIQEMLVERHIGYIKEVREARRDVAEMLVVKPPRATPTPLANSHSDGKSPCE